MTGEIDYYYLKRRAPDFKEIFSVLFALITRQENKLEAKEDREGKAASQTALIPSSSASTATTTASQKRDAVEFP